MTELPASSPLRHHVVDVVLLRAEEQVLGLGAERAVAAVKHLHPNRDWPNGASACLHIGLPSLVMGMAPTSGIVRPLASVNGAVHSTRVYLS